MDPVHCSSVHFRVERSNDQVSLRRCRVSLPPNLQSIITRGEDQGERGTYMMIRSLVDTKTWPVLGGGLSSPGVGSYRSQTGFEFTEKI